MSSITFYVILGKKLQNAKTLLAQMPFSLATLRTETLGVFSTVSQPVAEGHFYTDLVAGRLLLGQSMYLFEDYSLASFTLGYQSIYAVNSD